MGISRTSRGSGVGAGILRPVRHEAFGHRLDREIEVEPQAIDAESAEQDTLRRDPHPHGGIFAVELDRRKGLAPDVGRLGADVDAGDLAIHFAFDIADHRAELFIRLVGEGDALAQKVDAGGIGPAIADPRLTLHPPVAGQIDAHARMRHCRSGRGFTLQHAADVARADARMQRYIDDDLVSFAAHAQRPARDLPDDGAGDRRRHLYLLAEQLDALRFDAGPFAPVDRPQRLWDRPFEFAFQWGDVGVDRDRDQRRLRGGGRRVGGMRRSFVAALRGIAAGERSRQT